MREGDDLFFAPALRFSEVKLDSPQIADQLQSRIEGYYLLPARACIEQRHAFAAGLILLSAVDFMSGFHHDSASVATRNVGSDFRAFVRAEMPSFNTAERAWILYDRFRNGLTHECRVKDGGDFSFDWPITLRLESGRPSINPELLLTEVNDALLNVVGSVRLSESRRHAAAARLRADFAVEFGLVERAAAG